MSSSYIRFFNGITIYHVDMTNVDSTLVRLVFDSTLPSNNELTSGFYIANEYTGANMSGDTYKVYSTVFKKENNTIWLSNDGSTAQREVMQFFLTNSNKLSTIPQKLGQLIFVEDTRTIYLDGDTRKAYEQIISIATNAERIAMTPTLVSGFYFVNETNILWRLDNGTWIQITERPQEQIVYGTIESFPVTGKTGVLYMTDEALYHFDTASGTYVDYCKSSPQWIEG